MSRAQLWRTAFPVPRHHDDRMHPHHQSVECPHQGDIVAVLPRNELAAVDVVLMHASVKSHAAQAAKEFGWTAVRAERTERTLFRKDVPDHASFRFVPFVEKTCRYRANVAVRFVKCLGDIAADIGRIPKGAFVRWAMQLLSMLVQGGNADMYHRNGLFIPCEQGMRYDAGFAVPVLCGDVKWMEGQSVGASSRTCIGHRAHTSKDR